MIQKSVMIDGIEYHHLWSVRDIIDLQEFDNGVQVVKFYKDVLPDDAEQAVNEYVKFLNCGREFVQQRRQPKNIDYKVDADLIFSALKQTYQWNFYTEDETTHWWEFSAMMKNCGSDSLLADVMYARSGDLSKVPNERLPYFKKLKILYRLPE